MKTETKHTPGPLTVSRDTTNAAQWTIEKSHGYQPSAEQAGVGYVVATARCYHQADAVLYAAAPELLEALQDVLRYCVTVKGMPDKDKGRTDEQQAAYAKARAAIAKAVNQ